jgi:excisionase family DNA binding protein
MNNVAAASAPPRILPKKWDGKFVFDVPEVAEIFEVTPWAIYEAIKRGDVRAVRIGRLLKVPRQVLEEMLAA